MFLREGEGVSCGLPGARPEIGGEENVLQLDFLFCFTLYPRADGEHGDIGLAEDLLGNRADENLLDLAAAVSTRNDKINFMGSDQLVERGPDIAFFHQDFVRNTAKLSGNQNVRDTFLGSLTHLFISGLSELRFRELERVRVNHVSQIDPRVVAPSKRKGIIQGPIRDFGKIGRDKDFG